VMNSLHLLIQIKKTVHGRRLTHISIIDDDKNIIDIFTYDEKSDLHTRVN